MELKCNYNYDDVYIKKGRISFCKNTKGLHWFILVESGKYIKDVFVADDKKRVAFSYVPAPTKRYITNKYNVNSKKNEFVYDENDSAITTLWGYIAFVFTKSYVIDTWKLTDEYIIIKSKPVKKWKFHRFPEFNTYNILSVIPWFGITDCIGYSNYHFQAA